MSRKVTRRQVLKAAATLPAAALPGCQSLPGGNAGPMANVGVSRVRRADGRGRPPSHAVGPFPIGTLPPEPAVAKRVRWDFERFVKEILKRLDNGHTDAQVNYFATTISEQEMNVPGHGQRNLNVKVHSSLEFSYETDSAGKNVVAGIKIKGCLARYTGKIPQEPFDGPYPLSSKSCEEAASDFLAKSHHLVSSSSSSSSSWGIP